MAAPRRKKRRTSEIERETEGGGRKNKWKKRSILLSLHAKPYYIRTRSIHIFNTFAVSRTTNLFLLFDLIFKMVCSPLVRTLLLYVLWMRACVLALLGHVVDVVIFRLSFCKNCNIRAEQEAFFSFSFTLPSAADTPAFISITVQSLLNGMQRAILPSTKHHHHCHQQQQRQPIKTKYNIFSRLSYLVRSQNMTI